MIVKLESELPDDRRATPVFLCFPNSSKSDWPDSDKYAGSWLLDPVVDDGELIRFRVRKAKDKVRGGGTFPVTWRKSGKPLELEKRYELPLSLWNQMKIVEQVPNMFLDRCVVRLVSSDI